MPAHNVGLGVEGKSLRARVVVPDRLSEGDMADEGSGLGWTGKGLGEEGVGRGRGWMREGLGGGTTFVKSG